ncbi:MAG TPA: hypothetical protein DDW21_04525 [Verrucomicrobiales bacterium]|nr:MAG: hypothetical protein B9S37_11935 [Verrucomicrobiae bacterium Tous-C3TDCM]PAZ05904.1 MAG: hypothetical protein CAK88_06135 [Verrucomicrobiae bacterium AMD-G2]HBE22702.1 hypothetical protein [Verrucomicrobiales bacterium]
MQERTRIISCQMHLDVTVMRVDAQKMITPTLAYRQRMQQRPSGPAVMKQQWADLLFLHGRMDAEALQKRLPAGLWIDTFENEAWVGIVPFFMNRIRPCYLPAVPRLSWFLELNVRTYIHDDAGNPGVWFFSLDCNQTLAVKIAQNIFHLPYEHAQMHATRLDGMIDYRCRRDGCDETAHYRYEPCSEGKEATAGTLEYFLLERYRLFSANKAGNIFTGDVHHSPYRFREARCEVLSSLPALWDGLEFPIESVFSAESVNVEVFPLRRHHC